MHSEDIKESNLPVPTEQHHVSAETRPFLIDSGTGKLAILEQHLFRIKIIQSLRGNPLFEGAFWVTVGLLREWTFDKYVNGYHRQVQMRV